MGSVAVRSLLLAKSSDYFLLKPQHPGTNSPYSSPHISLMNKLREFIKGAASIVILLIPLRTFTARGKLMLVRGGGENSWEFLVGVCLLVLQILTLFQTKKCHFLIRVFRPCL